MSGTPSGSGLIPTGAAGSNMQRQKMTPQQQNSMARQLIFNRAKPIFQQVTSKTITNIGAASGNNVIQVNPLQIGWIRRFYVEVAATVVNSDTSHAALLAPFGADMIISNLTFNDFTGNPRHNCSGRSLSFVEAAKYKEIPGAAYTTDSVSGFGSNIGSNTCGTIASSGTVTMRRIFEVPIMVDAGLNQAGGLWLGTNSQTTSLNITVNPAPIVAASGDPLNAVWQLASGGSTIGTTPITSCTVTIYQDYWNDVPVDKTGNPILPQQDLQTAYMITETNSGLTFAQGQASSWSFPTFSKMMGTYIVFDNGGTLSPGTDVSTIALTLSNYAIVKQYDPYVLDRLVRAVMQSSYPDGTYALITRQHQLNVDQYPALQLQFTPSSVNSGAKALITTELLRPVQYMAAASGMGSV